MGASFSYLCSQTTVLSILAIHLEYTGGYTFALDFIELHVSIHYLEEWRPNYVKNVQSKTYIVYVFSNPLNTSKFRA